MSISKVKSPADFKQAQKFGEHNTGYYKYRPYWSKIKFNAITGIIKRRNKK